MIHLPIPFRTSIEFPVDASSPLSSPEEKGKHWEKILDEQESLLEALKRATAKDIKAKSFLADAVKLCLEECLSENNQLVSGMERLVDDTKVIVHKCRQKESENERLQHFSSKIPAEFHLSDNIGLIYQQEFLKELHNLEREWKKEREGLHRQLKTQEIHIQNLECTLANLSMSDDFSMSCLSGGKSMRRNSNDTKYLSLDGKEAQLKQVISVSPKNVLRAHHDVSASVNKQKKMKSRRHSIENGRYQTADAAVIRKADILNLRHTSQLNNECSNNKDSTCVDPKIVEVTSIFEKKNLNDQVAVPNVISADEGDEEIHIPDNKLERTESREVKTLHAFNLSKKDRRTKSASDSSYSSAPNASTSSNSMTVEKERKIHFGRKKVDSKLVAGLKCASTVKGTSVEMSSPMEQFKGLNDEDLREQMPLEEKERTVLDRWLARGETFQEQTTQNSELLPPRSCDDSNKDDSSWLDDAQLIRFLSECEKSRK